MIDKPVVLRQRLLVSFTKNLLIFSATFLVAKQLQEDETGPIWKHAKYPSKHANSPDWNHKAVKILGLLNHKIIPNWKVGTRTESHPDYDSNWKKKKKNFIGAVTKSKELNSSKNYSPEIELPEWQTDNLKLDTSLSRLWIHQPKGEEAGSWDE